MIPIEKQKGVNALNNFRPISILPVMSKLLERVVYSQLLSYLNTNDILSPHQSGFRQGHSTMDIIRNRLLEECYQ